MNVVDVEPYEDPAAPGAWSASCWLQESYTVSHSLATESFVSAAGPLTVHMHAEDFTDFQVPFGTSVFAFFGVLIFLLATHELYTAASKKPLLADHENSNNFQIQLMFLIIWFGFFVNSSLIVPLSLDYAIAMGQSATASGVFLGCGTILSVVGLVVGKTLNSETNWNQAFARKTYMCFNSLSVALNLSLALLTQASVHWSLPARQQFFWWSQLLLGSVFGAAALPTISWNTLWNKITPPQEKTFWMIMAQCCRNGGFLLGPPLFAAISWAVRRGRDASWLNDTKPCDEIKLKLSFKTFKCSSHWCLVGNGGMDPHSSPFILFNDNPHNPFPHSLPVPGLPYLLDGVVFHGFGRLVFAELDLCIPHLSLED